MMKQQPKQPCTTR